jgi:hypothetical protein
MGRNTAMPTATFLNFAFAASGCGSGSLEPWGLNPISASQRRLSPQDRPFTWPNDVPLETAKNR